MRSHLWLHGNELIDLPDSNVFGGTGARKHDIKMTQKHYSSLKSSLHKQTPNFWYANMDDLKDTSHNDTYVLEE